jgi:class 3 adenylate cyclase
MPNLPSGTVTFLFSDIEGSTSLLKQLGDADYAGLVSLHRRLVRETFGGYGGQEIDTQGDAFFYSFPRARDAVAGAVDVQRAHATAKWPRDVRVRLRIGLHTGEPAVGDEGYTGLDVVRASRLAAIGRGGQVLLSDTTRAIVANDLPDGVRLRPMGERRLRDIEQPEPLTELVIPDVEVSEPAGPMPPPEPHAENRRSRRAPAPLPPGVPDWVSGAIGQWVPGGDRARDLIEERVLSAMEDAFAEKAARRERRRPRELRDQPRAAHAPASVADQIDRLRALRDDGALTEDQYRRAVDRVVGDEV